MKKKKDIRKEIENFDIDELRKRFENFEDDDNDNE